MEPSHLVESRAKELQANVLRLLEESLRVIEGALTASSGESTDDSPSVLVISPSAGRTGAKGQESAEPRSETLILVLNSITSAGAALQTSTGSGIASAGTSEGQRTVMDPGCPPAKTTSPADANADKLSIDGLTLDFARHRAAYGGNGLQLTNREFTLLSVLALSRGRVVPAVEIVREFGTSLSGTGREAADLVKAVVLRTRRKLASAHADPHLIMTVRGVGYMIDTQMGMDSAEPAARPEPEPHSQAGRSSARAPRIGRSIPAARGEKV